MIPMGEMLSGWALAPSSLDHELCQCFGFPLRVPEGLLP